nr:pentapeptide repeat-containing protein [uncultured Campylobacter sp.]
MIGEFSDKNSIFQKKLVLYDKNIKESCIFKDKTEFIESVFQRITDFSHCVFESDITFKKCEFLYDSDKKGKVGDADADFSSIDFRGEVYFDQSKFKGFAAFHMSKFAKQTSFYETEFDKMPNFSPGNFGNVVYFNTTRWKHGFEFENIKESIETAYNAKGDESDKKRDDQLKENIINFRDSCRAIKNTLIEQNNLLDAQNFHKAELYCKEIELRDRMNQEYLSNSNKVKIKINSNLLLKERFCVLIATLLSCWFGFFYFEHKSVLASFLYGSIFVLSLEIFVRIVIWLYRFVLEECNEIKYKCSNFDIWFDWIILLLYRYTSEHHTNINRILHVLLIVIVSYSFTLFVFDYIINYALVDFLTFSVLLCIAVFFFKKFFHQNILLINLKVLIYFFLSLIFVCLVAKITYILHYIFSIFILFSFYSLKNSFCIFISRAIIYVIAILILALQPEILNPIIGIHKSSEYKNSKLNELMDNISYDKLVALASNVTQEAPSALNAKSPREIIIENKNIIKDSTEFNASFDSLKQAIKQDEVIYATRQSMSVIYIVLLVLCLYSLQKTARKNTIVPS